MLKKLIIVILVLLFLLLALMAIILIPAHLQVRSVTPTLPQASELLSLQNEAGPKRVRFLLTSTQKLTLGYISHISIVVEWADGKIFLIDAAMDQKAALEFAGLLKRLDWAAGEASIKGSVVSLLADDIKRVKGVGFTHLHIDHTQGLNSFCQARGQGAMGLQSTAQAKLHNFNTRKGAKIVQESCLEMRSFNGDSLTTFDNFPGIAAFALGGHTPGSTLWAVALNDKILLFSGDITNDKTSIDHNQPKPALYSNVLVPENVNRTAELRKWLFNLDKNEQFSVIVSHDLANTRSHLSEYPLK